MFNFGHCPKEGFSHARIFCSSICHGVLLQIPSRPLFQILRIYVCIYIKLILNDADTDAVDANDVSDADADADDIAGISFSKIMYIM